MDLIWSFIQTIVVVLLVFGAPAILNKRLAIGKNRNAPAWMILVLFLSWWSTLILACLPKRESDAPQIP